jgi:heme exporter protein C
MSIWRFANPTEFMRISALVLPWATGVAAVTLLGGMAWGLFFTPPDYQQGETVRIMYIHVPAAMMAINIYFIMAVASVIGFVRRHHVSFLVAKAAAPIGAGLTLAAIITGAIWGQPTWGTWWVWDARLTSELILLFLYLGYIALVNAIDDVRRADQAGALLALVGSVNVPIIYFSVKWWNTLHQGATVSMTAAPKMASTMLTAMLIMTFACWAYAFAAVFTRTRAIVIEREAHAGWVAELTRGKMHQ